MALPCSHRETSGLGAQNGKANRNEIEPREIEFRQRHTCNHQTPPTPIRMRLEVGDYSILSGHSSVSVNGNWRLTFAFENGDTILIDYQDDH